MATANQQTTEAQSTTNTDGTITDSQLLDRIDELGTPSVRVRTVAEDISFDYTPTWVRLNTLAFNGSLKRVREPNGDVHFARPPADLTHLNVISRDIPNSIKNGVFNSTIQSTTPDTTIAASGDASLPTFDDRRMEYESYWWCIDMLRLFGPLQRDIDATIHEDPKPPLTIAYLAAKNAKKYWRDRTRDLPGDFRAYRNEFNQPAFDHVRLDHDDLLDYGIEFDSDDDPIFLAEGTTIPSTDIDESDSNSDTEDVPLPDGTHETVPEQNIDTTNANTDDTQADTDTTVISLNIDVEVTVDSDISPDDIEVNIDN